MVKNFVFDNANELHYIDVNTPDHKYIVLIENNQVTVIPYNDGNTKVTVNTINPEIKTLQVTK